MSLWKRKTGLIICVLFLLFLSLISCSNEIVAKPAKDVQPIAAKSLDKTDKIEPPANKLKTCGECQYLRNGICVDYECCDNWDCNNNEQCRNHQCITLNCGSCGYAENHVCQEYFCCSNDKCDDSDSTTYDVCNNPGTKLAECIFTPITQQAELIQHTTPVQDTTPVQQVTPVQDSPPVQSVNQVVPFTGTTNPCDNPNSKLPECNYNSHSEPLELSLVPHHEDSAIFVQLNMDKLENFEDYFSMGFMVYKENGQLFQPFGSTGAIGHFIKTLEKKRYKISVSNLKPNSEYEVCLTGQTKDFATTGYFNCKTIRTQNEKQKKAIVFVNYDVSSQTRNLIDEWINEIEKTGISIEKQNLNQESNGNDVYSLLKTKYSESNLLYAVFVGQDLPMPMITLQTAYYNYEEPTPFSFPLRSLTFDTTNQDSGFLGPTHPLNEITLAVIKYDDETKLNNYFQRVINHYKSPKEYTGKILLADAMIPAESSINNYNFQNMDYLGGITDYGNVQQANTWQTQYKQKLKENQDILVINAHGSQEIHYPCGQACVHAEFIRANPTKIPFIMAVSCNIGYFMEDSSPMLSYVFEGESLAGIGSELVSVDINGVMAKYMIEQMLAGKNTGDTSRMLGFTVIGDPFLKLNQ
ncbi:hypothetical protein GF358_00620 [Candidatus Woesearchaeota archaeon]|nr:hypothetical protein [Candidatus Woesearchaeota archaeon]